MESTTSDSDDDAPDTKLELSPTTVNLPSSSVVLCCQSFLLFVVMRSEVQKIVLFYPPEIPQYVFFKKLFHVVISPNAP